ncbi:UNVERIFIED_CONTAM: DNA-directed RNA polymerase, partial [Kocuria sp. CPCC 205274]
DEELDPIFKYDTCHSYYLADIVFKATSQTVIKASECMDYIQDVTDILKSEGKPLEWVTQDGFYVRQEYLEQLPHRPKLSKLVINQGVKIRQVFRPQFLVDPKEGDTVKFISKQRSSVAPNFIHSMDATHLRMTVRACHKKGVRTFGVIHDSFGTIPADAQTMFETVRETMVEMYQDNPCMLDQIDSYLREHSECKQLPQPPAKGKLNLSGIIESKYAFI